MIQTEIRYLSHGFNVHRRGLPACARQTGLHRHVTVKNRPQEHLQVDLPIEESLRIGGVAEELDVDRKIGHTSCVQRDK